MATELILIRHGESEANVGRSKDPDCPITENGLDQARRLARRIQTLDLAGFVALTSPYQRTTQTANEIARATGLSFTLDEGVREWGDVATVGGREYPKESVHELVERLGDFLRRHEGRRLIVVSHAAPIAILTHLAWGEIPVTTGPFWLEVPNCSLRWLRATNR